LFVCFRLINFVFVNAKIQQKNALVKRVASFLSIFNRYSRKYLFLKIIATTRTFILPGKLHKMY